MTSFSSMSLYALTVKQPSATQDAISGDFIGNGKQQILTASGSRLAILEVSRRQKGFQEIYSQDVFGIIRRIAKFRIAGGTKGMSFLIQRYEFHSDYPKHPTRSSSPLLEPAVDWTLCNSRTKADLVRSHCHNHRLGPPSHLRVCA
jgi:hypothetical protein